MNQACSAAALEVEVAASVGVNHYVLAFPCEIHLQNIQKRQALLS